MILAREDAASYGPKSSMVPSEPVVEHGSEGAGKSGMTYIDSGSDLDQETARLRTSGRVLRTRRRRWRGDERSESAERLYWSPMPRGSTSERKKSMWRFPRTGTRIPSAGSAVSPAIYTPWQIGWCAVAFARWPWSPPESTGFRCFRFWKPGGWKFIWSTRTH